MSSFDDYGDEMPEEFTAFAAGVRAAATRMPEPSRALADLLIAGVSSPQPKRSVFMKLKTYVTGLGLAAKVMLSAGVAAAATTGAGAAGVLPGPVQHVFASTVDSVTPFNLPDPASDKGVEAAGDRANDHADDHGNDHNSDEPPVTPTTIGHDEHHDGDHPIVVEPTTTSTTLRHDEPHTTTTINRDGEHHESTTTTTMRHEEPTTTSTTITHDGDNNNPESLSITCSPVNTDGGNHYIVCHWTASTNPEHARYALLRINNQNSESRVVMTTETGLEGADAYVTPGWGYGYRVVSLRSDGSTESHSNMFTIMCC